MVGTLAAAGASLSQLQKRHITRLSPDGDANNYTDDIAETQGLTW